jgi:molybdenum cofactor guanylyltransferase
MNYDRFNTTGIILAGGKSSRMGKEKGLVVYKGKKLVEYSVGFLTPLSKTIILSANDDRYKQFGYPVIWDQYKKCGPMGGIHACLEASRTESNLVLACDIVPVPENLLETLFSFAPGYHAVVPVHPDGKAEPLCAWYHKSLVSSLKKKLDQGKVKMIDFLKEERTYFLPLHEVIHDYHAQILPNINYPKDLR